MHRMLLLVATALAVACKGDTSGPPPPPGEPNPPVRLYAAGGNGQQGAVGNALGELSARVADEFDDGVAGVPVTWSVASGDASLAPSSDPTDGEGISRTTVTLGSSPGPVVITATSEGLEGSPVQFTAMAHLYVHVEDNYFSPANLSVPAGTAVTWNWTGMGPHNVVPDGSEPARSGDPAVGQAWYQYTVAFDTPGVYRYYCELHGGPDGAGMSGVIQVTP